MDIISYILSKKYTDKCLQGGGSLKGANCTIESIEEIEGGNRVTFAWTENDGTTETETMDVMNGAIDTIKVNSSVLPISNKTVNIDLSDYATQQQLQNLDNTKLPKTNPSGVGNLNMTGTITDGNGVNFQNIFNLIYPIGSIYMSVEDTDPHDLFGIGIWQRIEDCFLSCAGDTLTANNINGELSHKLVESDIPSHTHTITVDSKTLTGGTNISATANSASGAILNSMDGILHRETSATNANYVPSDYKNAVDLTKYTPYMKLTVDATHNHTASASSYGKSGSSQNALPLPKNLPVYVWMRVAETPPPPPPPVIEEIDREQ